jgi:hypothetical protein
VKVDLSDRALREMQRIDASWRKRASSPDVFLDELEETIEAIEVRGLFGVFYDAKGKHRVHRLLMKKSEYHVYLVRKSDDLVIVVAIWSARRKRGPKL